MWAYQVEQTKGKRNKNKVGRRLEPVLLARWLDLGETLLSTLDLTSLKLEKERERSAAVDAKVELHRGKGVNWTPRIRAEKIIYKNLKEKSIYIICASFLNILVIHFIFITYVKSLYYVYF